VIFVVISYLVFTLIYGQISTFVVFAVPADNRWGGTGECDAGSQTAELTGVVTCCWFEEPEAGAEGPEVKYCQACASEAGGGLNCNPKYVAMLTPPTAGETVLPGDGVLE
jgi:hypothetical protein